MVYDFNPFKNKLTEIESWLSKEFLSIRTGRATPTILDGITVEAYGSKMSLNQVGTINIEDPKTLRISPWDTSQIKSIESAVSSANLGLSVAVDDKGIRVIFPDLTGERRAMLIKVAKEKLEDARIRMRKERDDEWQIIQKNEKDGEIGEDDKFRYKDEMQKIIEQCNEKLDQTFEKKEKEINN